MEVEQDGLRHALLRGQKRCVGGRRRGRRAHGHTGQESRPGVPSTALAHVHAPKGPGARLSRAARARRRCEGGREARAGGLPAARAVSGGGWGRGGRGEPSRAGPAATARPTSPPRRRTGCRRSWSTSPPATRTAGKAKHRFWGWRAPSARKLGTRNAGRGAQIRRLGLKSMCMGMSCMRCAGKDRVGSASAKLVSMNAARAISSRSTHWGSRCQVGSEEGAESAGRARGSAPDPMRWARSGSTSC